MSGPANLCGHSDAFTSLIQPKEEEDCSKSAFSVAACKRNRGNSNDHVSQPLCLDTRREKRNRPGDIPAWPAIRAECGEVIAWNNGTHGLSYPLSGPHHSLHGWLFALLVQSTEWDITLFPCPPPRSLPTC
jgi:hypothetical protein